MRRGGGEEKGGEKERGGERGEIRGEGEKEDQRSWISHAKKRIQDTLQFNKQDTRHGAELAVHSQHFNI